MSSTEPAADDGTAPSAVGGLLGRIPRLGVWSWSFVGFVVASVIVLTALAAVSEIVLPMTFAAVLAVMFKPFVGTLQRHGLKPSAAAGLIVLGLIVLMIGVVVATVRGVADQTDQIGDSATAALEEAAGSDRRLASTRRRWPTPGRPSRMLPDITTGVLAGLVGIGVIRRDRRGHHPRSAHHVLPAQGRHPPARSLVDRSTPAATRSTASSATRAGSCVTTGGSHRHVGCRGGGRRPAPSCSACARVPHHGGELHGGTSLHRRSSAGASP
jgi:uncharacterized membrane protein